MKPTAEWLASLIQRIPVYDVDLAESRRTGNVEALRYAEAMQRWQDEAIIALAEAIQVRSSASGSRKPDAFAQTANAAALMRLEAAE